MSFIKGPNGEDVIPIKIGGVIEPLNAQRLFEVVSAAEGRVVHYAQSATAEQAVRAADAAYDAYLKWRNSKHTTRRDLLFRAADIIESRRAKFVHIQMLETSCPESWAQFNVTLLANCLREIGSNISHATTGELPPTETLNAVGLVFREPVGPILAISPWNASMILSGRALAGPIGAGCSVVLKASELSPLVHHSVIEVFEDAGMPKGLVSVLQSARQDSPVITETLIAHQAIRKIEFTGSAKVGKIIGQLGSKHLKPVLMELGGKAPAVVLPDANLKHAAAKIVDGAFMHHGQICMSTDRIIVLREVADALVAELRSYIQTNYANGAGHSVSRAQAQRAHTLLHKARDAGAKFIIGDASLDKTHSSLTPTIITDVDPSDALFKEEIFSAACILIVVETEDEAVQVANNTEYGLNAAVHSTSILNGLRVAKQIEAGQVHINTITEYDEANMPIGGTKGSGWGRNNGKFALREFLIEKTITIHDPSCVVGENGFGSQG